MISLKTCTTTFRVCSMSGLKMLPRLTRMYVLSSLLIDFLQSNLSFAETLLTGRTPDFISREKDMLGFSLIMSSTTREVERRITNFVIDLSQVHGGRGNKKEMVDQLLSESSQGVASVSPSIISIVGKGGTRKTTLARLAYRDNRLNIHFDKKNLEGLVKIVAN